MSEMEKAKTKELTDENIKLSLKNEALHPNVESLASIEANLEAKLEFEHEDRRQAVFSALKAQSFQTIVKNTRRQAEEKLAVVKEMVLLKDKQLAEVLADLVEAKEQLARLEAPNCADPKEAARS
ncbi:hypothetical protein Fot_38054 [Forsythia ovata]|uniref:RAB6-interacting golgin n=1 Tax=Forsythia ovata TaxID=205694 RepID=A0ABD1S0U6_9LAMI